MEMHSLRDLYVSELRDLLNAEQQLLKTLPKMAKAATSSDLQQAFEEHTEQTKEHVDRLQQVFEKMNMSARGRRCKGIEGIIEEGKEIMEEADEDKVRDAGLIAAAQRAEHYEIAAYGCVRTYAKQLGEEDAARLLQQTLDEEEQTDKKLTELAERHINVEAAQPAA